MVEQVILLRAFLRRAMRQSGTWLMVLAITVVSLALRRLSAVFGLGETGGSDLHGLALLLGLLWGFQSLAPFDGLLRASGTMRRYAAELTFLFLGCVWPCAWLAVLEQQLLAPRLLVAAGHAAGWGLVARRLHPAVEVQCAFALGLLCAAPSLLPKIFLFLDPRVAPLPSLAASFAACSILSLIPADQQAP